MSLPIQLQREIEGFLADHDLGTSYREYKWGEDTWENGFPDMRQLEVDLMTHAKQGYVTEIDIMRVAKRGRLRNKKRIQCPELVRISLYGADDPAVFFKAPPSVHLSQLRKTIKGMGSTYLSKILMFSQPQLYGAIDTRLVRVFGRGDANIEHLRWLLLEVRNYGYGWYIPEYQKFWPSEYDTWIEILHYIARICDRNRHKCPHPDQYIAVGLREKGIWIAADVETALFSYASARLQAGP